MTATITPLPIQDSALKLDTFAAAPRLYLRARDQQDFAFAPTLADTVERHARLLNNFRNKLIGLAQSLDAKLQPDSLGKILTLLSDVDVSDLAEEVVQQVSDVGDALKQQVDFIRGELKDCKSLPALEAEKSLHILEHLQADNASKIAEAEKTSAKLATQLADVDEAVAKLQNSKLETQSGGLVPSKEQMALLLGAGPEAELAMAGLEAATKALELALNVSVVGMSFENLYSEAHALRSRSKGQAAELRELLKNSALLTSQVEKLGTVPQLQTQLDEWNDIGTQLANTLEQYHMSLNDVAVKSTEDIRDLRASCKKIRALELRLIEQIVG